jgi:ABC-2 type transport system permease protein
MPIYDQTYRHIDSVKRPPRLVWLAMLGVSLRLFFRDKRRLIPGALTLIPFAMGLIGVLLPFLVPPGVKSSEVQGMMRNSGVDGSTIYTFLVFPTQWLAIFLYAMLAGAGLVTNDLKANALELYFSRPLTLTDYFLGKLGAVLAVLSFFTLLPAFVLWILDIAVSSDPQRLWTQLPLLPRIVAASLVVTLPYATLVLAISAMARSQRLAVVGFAAIVGLTQILGNDNFAAMFDSDAMQLIALKDCVDRVAFEILDVSPQESLLGMFDAKEPLSAFTSTAPTVVVIAWVALSTALFYRRVRAVEIVAT